MNIIKLSESYNSESSYDSKSSKSSHKSLYNLSYSSVSSSSNDSESSHDSDYYINKHQEFENNINDMYNFKSIWAEKCSKYNIESQPFILPPVRRIIVIGDIHGDLKMTYETLKIAELIDNNNNWIGGDTVLVQVGDQIDRCRNSSFMSCENKDTTLDDEGNDWKILKYFTELHYQAREHGGAVYSLLGNHELMNVQQRMDYVSYEGLNELNNYVTPNGNVIKNGKNARLWAFKPGNPISEFLACTRQVAIIIGTNLFVHAGILPSIAKKYNISTINKLMSLYLFNKLDDNEYINIMNAPDYSPLWTRKIGNIAIKKFNNNNINNNNIIDNKKLCNKLMNPLKKIYKIGKLYIGHTPMMNSGISSMCDNKIWMTDYGLSSAFNKFDNNRRSIIREAHVLEILDDGKIFNILKKSS